jgi:proteasome accessory factor C
VAAIDLLGEHVPAGALNSAREKIVAALGEDPVVEGLQITSAGADDPGLARVIAGAIRDRRVLELEYYAANEDQFSLRTIEPYGLINSAQGWYVASWDPSREDTRHFRLDRIKRATVLEETYVPRPDLDPVADIEGWPKTGQVPASRTAHVWISPEQARWAREERTVVAELEEARWWSSGRSRARTTWSRRSSRRPATPRCSSRPRPARPSGAQPSACSRRRPSPPAADPCRAATPSG